MHVRMYEGTYVDGMYLRILPLEVQSPGTLEPSDR